MTDRPMRKEREVNLALHVWLDAPGLWDELVLLSDPIYGASPELREAAEYMMTKSPNDIEMIGWMVLEDDRMWEALTRSIRSSIIEMATKLKAREVSVVSSGDGQKET